MKKIIDLDKSVHDLVEEYPELVEIMSGLGFSEITKKAMLKSVGKIMTIPKGAEIKGISLDVIKVTLKENGFEIKNELAQEAISHEDAPAMQAQTSEATRKDLLKEYLSRLENQEDLESVREDFVEKFSHVEAAEIMEAEQELIQEGVPLAKVQKLCDLHSALFHGLTAEEQIVEAKNTVIEKSDHLPAELGHPLHTFSQENDYLEKVIKDYRKSPSETLLQEIAKIPLHYSKKGDLLYPLLNVEYAISGPNDVMWKVDDEIRDELSRLRKEAIKDKKWQDDLNNVLNRAEEMVYKERNILYPICAENFSQEEWYQIYHDLKGYEWLLASEKAIWQEAEAYEKEPAFSAVDRITLPTGSFKIDELVAMLNTLPAEITFVDKDDTNQYFNDVEGLKAFKRPQMALGRNVYACHPAHIEPMVRAIIEDFRAGKRDRVPVWMEKNGRTYLVTYLAVRDKANHYLGTLELVEDMEEAKEYFLKAEAE